MTTAIPTWRAKPVPMVRQLTRRKLVEHSAARPMKHAMPMNAQFLGPRLLFQRHATTVRTLMVNAMPRRAQSVDERTGGTGLGVMCGVPSTIAVASNRYTLPFRPKWCEQETASAADITEASIHPREV